MANVPVSAAVDLPKAGELVITGLMDAGLQDIVHIPGSGVFEARVKSYWSLSPQLRPWAVIQPRTTEEVSKTVKALVAITDCQFAIRRLVSNPLSTGIDTDTDTVVDTCRGQGPVE